MLRLTDTRGLAGVAGLFPGCAIVTDLRGLLHMEGFAGLVVLQRRALQVHAVLGGPHRRRVRAGAPPDPFAQAFRMRLEPQEARWIWEHRLRVGFCKTFAAQDIEKD